jgi:hypothetical protein
MNVGKRTLAYKVGEVYLCDDDLSIKEYEILLISTVGRSVYIKSDYGKKWVTLLEFHSIVKAKLGTYKTEGKWFWKKRVLVDE